MLKSYIDYLFNTYICAFLIAFLSLTLSFPPVPALPLSLSLLQLALNQLTYLKGIMILASIPSCTPNNAGVISSGGEEGKQHKLMLNSLKIYTAVKASLLQCYLRPLPGAHPYSTYETRRRNEKNFNRETFPNSTNRVFAGDRPLGFG